MTCLIGNNLFNFNPYLFGYILVFSAIKFALVKRHNTQKTARIVIKYSLIAAHFKERD